MATTISRRTFLKGSVGVAAGTVLLKPSKVEAKSTTKDIRYVHSICNFCSTTCSIKVAVKKVGGIDKAVKIEGNEKSTLNRGKICARGQSGLQQVYDPDRIKYPLIRVKGSKRGEWKFRKATWDEALDYITEVYKKENIQPWEISHVSGWTNCVFYMPVSLAFCQAFGMPNILASAMPHCVGSSHFGNDLVIGNFNIHDELLADYDKSDYILAAKSNASMGGISTSRAVRFAGALKRGAEVVILDPRLSETASKSTKWVPIKPGTDQAFFLAMFREMLYKGYYNEKFVRNNTNLTHLVMMKNGQPMPLMKMDKSGKMIAKLYVYDEKTKKVVAVPGYTNTNAKDLKGNSVTPALEVPKGTKAREFGNAEVMTVFQLFKMQLQKYTPEWASGITGVKAEDIRAVAKGFGTAKHPVMDPGWHGARYSNIIPLRRLQTMIQGLTGNIDKEGGWVFSGEYHHTLAEFLEKSKKGEPVPAGKRPGMLMAMGLMDMFAKPQSWEHGHPGFTFAKSINNVKSKSKEVMVMPAFADYGLKDAVDGKLMWGGKPYNVKFIIMNQDNPIRNYYSDKRWVDTLTSPNVKLTVAFDVLPQDHLAYADVILPSGTYLEREEPFVYSNGPNPDLMLTTRFQAIKPLYDSREMTDFLLDMFKRLGGDMDKFYEGMEDLFGIKATVVKKKVEEKKVVSLGIREATKEFLEEEAGKGAWEKMEKDGVLKLMDRKEVLRKMAVFHKLPAPTPSGRVEYYSYMLAQMLQTFPYIPQLDPTVTYIPTDVSKKTNLAENEFYFTYGKTPTESHASTVNNKYLMFVNKLMDPLARFGLWVNTDKAAKLGLKTGDVVRITNTDTNQKINIQVYVTESIRPDTVFMSGSFGIQSKNLKVAAGVGAPLTKIVGYKLEPIAAGYVSQDFTVKVEKI